MALSVLLLVALVVTVGADRPNIIQIMIDDVGALDLDIPRLWPFPPAAPTAHTPYLRQLADSGIVFKHLYVQPSCAPTRAALLTGRYPIHDSNGVYRVGDLEFNEKKGAGEPPPLLEPPTQNADVPLGTPTTPKLLQQQGYYTCHVGKFHVNDPSASPADLGFDFYYDRDHKGYFGESVYSKTQVKQIALFQQRHGVQQLLDLLLDTPRHLTDTLEAKVERCLTRASQPFYLQWHPYAAHGPHQLRPDLKGVYSEDKLGLIELFDQALGRLLAFLDTQGLRQSTLIVFLTDNGSTRWDPAGRWRGGKGTFYQNGIRVPMIVSMPGTLPKGAKVGKMLHAVDFLPTYLDLAGVSYMDTDGASFRQLLDNPQSKTHPRRHILYHFPGYQDSRARPLSQIVVRKKWKLQYFYETQLWYLYNLKDDTGETTSVLNAHTDVALRLCRKLRRWLKREGTQNDWLTDPLTGKHIKKPPRCSKFFT